MMEGFVTLGRGGLLLSFISVFLLTFVGGYLAAQAVAMIRKPVVREHFGCTELHCDVPGDMDAWLRSKDFTLITNEGHAELLRENARWRNRPTKFEAPKGLTPEQEQAIVDAIKAFDTQTGRHRRDQ